RDVLVNITKARTGWDARDAQIRFTMVLLLGKDVSCVAATGFGKSLAFQIAAFLSGAKFSIVITPIEALREDQVLKGTEINLRATVL
ncbi:hypothetical protein L211DRAFT_753602, partial [Terfezia boudieri ATCC MYA-4762]